jgi:hypothetical protein
MRKVLFALVIVASCHLLVAQQALNNDAIIKLVKAGLSDDLIVSTISASPGTYDASADGMIALKAAGVSDKVVAAIVTKAAVPAPVPTPAPAPVTNTVTTPSPTPQAPPIQPPAPPPPLPPFHSTDGKIRMYVTDHPIFESNGVARATADRHGASAAGVSHTQAGDDPRVVEVEADILKVCPNFIVASNNPDRSDLVLVFRRRGGSRTAMFAFGGLAGLALAGTMKVDGASLFQPDGDMVYATKQSTVEKAVRDVCAHIPPPATAPSPTPAAAPASALAPISPPPPPSH